MAAIRQFLFLGQRATKCLGRTFEPATRPVTDGPTSSPAALLCDYRKRLVATLFSWIAGLSSVHSMWKNGVSEQA